MCAFLPADLVQLPGHTGILLWGRVHLSLLPAAPPEAHASHTAWFGAGQLRFLSASYTKTQLTLCQYSLPLTPVPVLETHAAVLASAQPHVLALEASLP